MDVHGLLRAVLASTVVLMGVAVDEQEVFERCASQAVRFGLAAPVSRALGFGDRLAALSGRLRAEIPPEPFLGAPPDALAHVEDLGDGDDEGEAARVDAARLPARSATEGDRESMPAQALPGSIELASVALVGAANLESDTPPADPDEPVLVSIGRETWVLAEPNWDAKKLGYLRAGAVVRRREKFETKRGCRGGWYRIEPKGYVCVGSRATLERDHPIARLSERRPDVTGLPYLYALTRYPTPPLYARLPTADEQREVEGSVEGHLEALARLRKKPAFVEPPPPDPIPPALASRATLPSITGEARARDELVLGHARMRSGWALLGTYEVEGRRFGMTTDLMLVPLDRTRVVRPSTFHGVELSDEYGLPLAITRAKKTRSYSVDERDAVTEGRSLGSREPLPLTGREHRWRKGLLLEVRDGSWVRANDVTVIEPPAEFPRFARRGVKWIDVSLLRQTLVAYEGTRPVYATLVSTGKDGVEDHKDSHATIQGTFLIHTKHLTVTMDADEDEGDEFDLRDVPYVQYFKEGYALHAAYWHDDFGNPRSHGCVNLSPRDAAWLFGWTTPGVPEGWHAALSLKEGTIVHIHP